MSLRMSALAAAVLLLVTACSDGGGGGEAEQAASVNGEDIAEQDVQERYQTMVQYSQLGSQVYGNPAMQDQLQAQILSQLIQVELLRQGANELGVEVGDAEIGEQRYRIQQRLQGQGTSLDAEMQRQGLSEEDLRQELEALALQEAIAGELSGDEISDDEVRSYYEENTGQFHTAQVRLLTTESEEDAQQAIERVRGAEDFETVAESDLATGQGTSETTEVTRASLEQSSPELATAVFEDAEVGGVAGPVQGPTQGWYVVQVEERTQQELNDVEGQIREQLRNQQRSGALDEWLTEQAREADIEVAERYGTWNAYARQVQPATDQSGDSGAGGAGSDGAGSDGAGSGDAGADGAGSDGSDSSE